MAKALTAEQHEELVQHIDDVCVVNNGWHSDHHTFAFYLMMTGGFPEKMLPYVDEYPEEFIQEGDVSFMPTKEQYRAAAKTYCERLLERADKTAESFCQLQSFGNGMSVGIKDSDLLLEFFNKESAWRKAAIEFYLTSDEYASDYAEQIVYEPKLVQVLHDEIKAAAKGLDQMWSSDGELYDWSDCGPEIVEIFTEAGVFTEERTKAAEAAIQKAAARIEAFRPKEPGMSRGKYAAKMKFAMAGGEDVTGVINFINSLELPELSDKKLKGYTLERVLSETSPVGGSLLLATTGEEVERLVRGIYNKGRWNNFGVVEDVKPAGAEPYTGAPELEIVLINGDLKGGSEADAKKAIEATGATYTEEISEELTAIVQGENPFFKSEAFDHLAVEVIDEEVFWLTFPPQEPGLTPAVQASDKTEEKAEATPPYGFVFDPDADYFELFELCMADGTTDALDNPDDYGEFLQALKDGRYNPETGIAPATKADETEDETDDAEKAIDTRIEEILNQLEVEDYQDAVFKFSHPVLNESIITVECADELEEKLREQMDIYADDVDSFDDFKLSIIEVDPDNCFVTTVFWEENYGGLPGARTVACDTRENLEEVLIIEKERLGGHLAVVQYIEVVDGESKCQLAEDVLDESLYFALDWDAILENCKTNPDLVRLVGGEEAAAELTAEAFKQLVGSGKFPSIIKRTEESELKRLMLDPPSTASGRCYYRIDKTNSGLQIEHFETDSELEERIKDLFLSYDLEDIALITIKRIDVDEETNVTVFYYDSETTDIKGQMSVTLNNEADALLFIETTNSAWGGHCAVVRVEVKDKGTTTAFLAEGTTYGDDYWKPEYEDFLLNNQDDPALIKAAGGADKIKAMVEAWEQELDLTEFKELIRSGKWPA